MTSDFIYNPATHLTRWQRFQMYIWDKYGVDAGNLVGTLVSAFVAVVVLGIALVVQL